MSCNTGVAHGSLGLKAKMWEMFDILVTIGCSIPEL